MEPQGIVALISRLREKANRLITSELEARGAGGLAPSHGGILVNLYRHGPLPMGRLAGFIGRKKNTVTTLVAKLERLGYVTTAPDPADSRITLVDLTDKGREFRKEFDEISRILLDRIWGETPPEERKALTASLEKLLANLGSDC